MIMNGKRYTFKIKEIFSKNCVHTDSSPYVFTQKGSENMFFSCDLLALPISFSQRSKVQQSCVSSFQYIL